MRSKEVKGISVRDGCCVNTIEIVVNDGDTYWGRDLTTEEAELLVTYIKEQLITSKTNQP